MIIWNENMELYEQEKAEFEIDEQDDYEICLPLWQFNEFILEGENYDTFEISTNTGEK